MQSGFQPGSKLGTSVAVPMPSPCAEAVKHSLSQVIYDTTVPYPDMAVNERNIVFRRQAPQLQGMVLSKPPTGGIGLTRPSILVGADDSGVVYNTRLPPLFAVTDTPERVTLGPASGGPLTSDAPGSETVFRVPDGKLRNPHGAMSVRRAAQEAAAGAASAAQSHAQLLDSLATALGQQPSAPPQPPVNPMPYPVPVFPPSAAPLPPVNPMPYPVPVFPPVNPMPYPVPVFPPPAAPPAPPACPPCLSCTSPWQCFTTGMRNIGDSIIHRGDVLGTLRFYSNWQYLVALLLLVLLVVFFIVMVVALVQRDNCTRAVAGGRQQVTVVSKQK